MKTLYILSTSEWLRRYLREYGWQNQGNKPKKPKQTTKKQADKKTYWVLDLSTNSVQDQGRAPLVGAQNVYKLKHFAIDHMEESVRKMNVFILKVAGSQIG